MSWLQLRIDTSATLAPSCEEHLLLLGAVAVTLQDNADEPLFRPDHETTPLWQSTCVTGLFPAATDTAALWDALPDEIRDNCQHRAEILEDKDWEREWMRHYQPLQFSDKLWICPSWLEPPDPNADYKALGLKPGASQNEIRKAYYRLAKQHHPDTGGNPEKFQVLLESYERLSGDNGG